MDIARKKELLNLADSISKDINNQGCGNYIPKVLNAIKIASERHDKSMIHTVFNKMKMSEFGGNAQKQGFSEFVDSIYKNPHYRLNTLDFSELNFVFSWVRRIVKDKGNKTADNRNSYESNANQGYNKNNRYGNRNDKYNSYSKNNNFNRMNNNKSKNSQSSYNDTMDVNDNPFAALAKLKFK